MENKNRYSINGKDSMQFILEIVKRNCTETDESIYLFNVFKYLIRYPFKNGAEDLIKARDYLDRLIDSYKRDITFKLNTKVKVRKDTFEKYYTKEEEVVEEFKNAILNGLSADGVEVEVEDARGL